MRRDRAALSEARKWSSTDWTRTHVPPHFIRHGFNLADFACEEALYDIASLRRFAGIDLGGEAVPDATTLLKFRRLLEKHNLA